MKKGRRILVIPAALVLACLLTVLLWRAEKEPVYKGKKLSEWVVTLNGITPGHDRSLAEGETIEAIRALDTNAIPWLLKWMVYQPSPAKRNAYRLLKDLHFERPYRSLARLETRAANTLNAFRCLGPNREIAIPDLNRIMTNNPSYEISARARDTLMFMGKPTVPHLLAALTNQWRYRYELPRTFAIIVVQGNDNGAAVPILTKLLKDSDEATAESCARALAEIARSRSGPDRDVLVKTLIEAAQEPRPKVRIQALLGLGDLEPLDTPSRLIVPALIDSMDDPDAQVASYAIRLLAGAHSRRDLIVPAIVKRFKPADSVRIRTQLDALAHFGSHARSAVPAILQIMDKSASPTIWVAASNAVFRIDPGALQR